MSDAFDKIAEADQKRNDVNTVVAALTDQIVELEERRAVYRGMAREAKIAYAQAIADARAAGISWETLCSFIGKSRQYLGVQLAKETGVQIGIQRSKKKARKTQQAPRRKPVAGRGKR